MKWHTRGFTASIAVVAFLGLATEAIADEAPVTIPPAGSNTTPGPTTAQQQEVTAVSGPRAPDPFYQPKGIPLGEPGDPFRLFPNLFASLGYDDNVYRGKDGAKVSSSVFEVDPTLILDYDLERLRLDLYAQSSYQDLEQYNLWTYNGGLQGQFEITHDAMVSFNVSDGLFYEPYSSANTFAFQKRPNEYYLIDGSGKASYKPNRIGFTIGSSFDSYSYTRTPLNAPPFIQLNGDRNADIGKGWGEISYDFSPGYSAFVKATYNSDHYSHIDHRNPALEPAGVNRSSNGYEFDGGLDLLLGDLAQGEIYAGYLEQFYNKSQTHPLRDISGIDFGANITWYPTELLTVHLAGQRQIQNTTLSHVAGGDDKSGTLSVDYELLRRLHVLANVGFDDTRYRGSSPNREDQAFSAGIGGKFLLSHYVWINANYEYTNRSSTIGIAKYVDNVASVGLNLQD